MFKLFQSTEAKSVAEAKSVVFEGMTLAQVYQALLALLAGVSVNHHQMGQLYNYTVKNKLAEKAGYKDAKAWFTQHLVDVSEATLRTYGAVAEAFSEEVTRRFGVTRLSLLLTYEEVADMEASHEEPGPTLIEVPGPNGQVEARPFSGCNVEQLRKAIQRKRKPTSSKPLPAGALERGAQYDAALKARFPVGSTVEVQVRNVKGKAVLDFQGIPYEQVNKLLEVLTGELPPVPEAPRLLEKLVPQA